MENIVTNCDSELKPYELEFHISRTSRDKYQFNQALFATNGNVIFANFRAARDFAQRMNERRNARLHPELAVRAGDINAMGLIDEILHLVIVVYRTTRNPGAFQQALVYLDKNFGQEIVDHLLFQFCEQFPPRDVFQGNTSARDYLNGRSKRTDGKLVPNRELLLEEMLMLWVANQNPAQRRYSELFSDNMLKEETRYSDILIKLYDYFATQPPFGPENQNLIDVLLAPARAHPNSLAEQLDYIRKRWSGWISIDLIRLLSSLDIIREEQKPAFSQGGDPQSLVYSFTGEEYTVEPERFSQDLYWMPNLVLIAKNTYVWLDQLARKYQQPINQLDQVPEEEMALLASWGFSGLWLIGLWERSLASRQIKQMRGNPDAVASAYSLLSYDIAADLGGEGAYQVLRERAWKFGIRLASDMVPNHMGIDSHWVIEHPDWFIMLPYSPFPSYSFNGPDLSADPRVGIFIEDHYFDNSDAAVVFKRVDRWTGDERFIYHGNDGTSMPWNDTAQLNYLIPEVREAVIQTILHVARKFPIIRFDAAMTLAKRHYQRLWFPEPGSGGDIPSRSEHGMSKARFNKLFPEEFWRMVVDRVAAEAPDTLLLAEAFWLMEGYFVRTLGMHRVYNSAFMNMLRDEKNQEYRLVIKNTLEFDPQILKRYVNFMNNPDERTAVDQFGKGDKYFGICTMMAAMPGLPMFGHGQVEGYTEKYGMEFRYPKWHETPDEDLVDRHARQIFPLLRRRHIFADVRNFRLYDFFTSQGSVDEDVYAFSNQNGNQRALVIFHNRFSETQGWIRLSAAYPADKGADGGKALSQTSLAEAFDLKDEPDLYTIFRDFISGTEFIRPNQELVEKGLFFSLNAYRCLVFMDFEQVRDDENHSLARLHERLKGEGVRDIMTARRELVLQKVLSAYQDLVNPGMLSWLIENRLGAEDFNPANYQKALLEADQKVLVLLEAVQEFTKGEGSVVTIIDDVHRLLAALLTLGDIRKDLPSKIDKITDQAVDDLLQGLVKINHDKGEMEPWALMICGLFSARLGEINVEADYQTRSRAWLDEWLLDKRIHSAMMGLGVSEEESLRMLELLRVLVKNQGWMDTTKTAEEMAALLIDSWIRDPAARDYLRVNAYEGVLWFSKESFDSLVWWVCAFEILQEKSKPDVTAKSLANSLSLCYLVSKHLKELEDRSGYRLDGLLEIRSENRDAINSLPL